MSLARTFAVLLREPLVIGSIFCGAVAAAVWPAAATIAVLPLWFWFLIGLLEYADR
jgi:hypothetical protein